MSGNIDRIPKAPSIGKYHESIIRYIWVNYTDFLNGESASADSDRFVCGFPLPSFQRDVKWTVDKMIRFIESVWLEVPLGSFTHICFGFSDNRPAEHSGLLLDGQQRLTALERYWNDEFPVFGLYFSELNKVEKNRFLNTKFGHFETNYTTEDDMKKLYNLMAFGGVAHTADEAAV